MEDALTALIVCSILFIGAPWVVLHYVTKWKQAPGIAPEDENLLDEMHALARRLEERVQTVERIVAADHPEFRALSATRPTYSPIHSSDRRN